MNQASSISETNQKANTGDGNERTWKALSDFVHGSGGKLHESLALVGGGSDRGVFASKDIEKGDLLIRLSPECVLSGKDITNNIRRDLSKPISSWMLCVAAYYQALTNQHWKPYFDSLPKQYETLFQWTDIDIQKSLTGTTLGKLIQTDRKEQSMQKRYQQAVRPFLKDLELLPKQESDEWDLFLQACMCISTRGFHYDATSGTSTNETSSYRGPFLLPVIDLLNHDPPRKCTTLQYSEGCFCMIAERKITKGEEILHSYGDSLTAAQLLQTFGFTIISKLTSSNENLTPACLSKAHHLMEACNRIKASSLPTSLAEFLEKKNMNEDENWNVSDIPSRDSEVVADDVLIEFSLPLSDELITYMCLQFLPQEAIEEIDASTTLDESILQDFYLGVLVCRSILLAVKLKLEEFATDWITSDESIVSLDTSVPQHIAGMLNDGFQLVRTCKINGSYREAYGNTVRIEELKSLLSICTEVNEILRSLYQGQPPTEYNTTAEDAFLPPRKRPKQQEKESNE